MNENLNGQDTQRQQGPIANQRSPGYPAAEAVDGTCCLGVPPEIAGPLFIVGAALSAFIITGLAGYHLGRAMGGCCARR